MKRWQKQDRRWNGIISYLRKYGGGSQAQLARVVGAHPSTIRRDLEALDRRRLVRVSRDEGDKRCKAATLGPWVK